MPANGSVLLGRSEPGDRHVVEVFFVRSAVGAFLRELALDVVAANGTGPVHGYSVALGFGGRLLAAHSARFVGHGGSPLAVDERVSLWHQREDGAYEALLAPLARDRNLDLNR